MAEDKLRYKTLIDFSRILSLFENGLSEEISVSDISKLLGMIPSKVSRMMKTLETEEFFEKNSVSGKYRLGPRYLQAGLIYTINHPLRKVILPHIEQISIELKTLSSWGIFHNNRIIIVDRITFSKTSPVLRLLGSGIPTFASAYGKLILSHASEADQEKIMDVWKTAKYGMKKIPDLKKLRQQFDQIREQGYAVDDGETSPQVLGFAAPIRDITSKMVAAVSIMVERSKTDKGRIEALSDYLINKALFISRQLGYQQDALA